MLDTDLRDGDFVVYSALPVGAVFDLIVGQAVFRRLTKVDNKVALLRDGTSKEMLEWWAVTFRNRQLKTDIIIKEKD